jgi:predicted nucleic acid-binding Zn ribbon protein
MSTAAAPTAIVRDTERCFICDYGFSRGRGDGRFCSPRCRAWFDAGNDPAGSPDEFSLIGWRVVAGPPDIEVGSDYYATIFGRQPIPMKRTTIGFKITCAGCGSEFESLGLRYCSDACGRKHRERAENVAIMASVGMEPATKRKCTECGVDLPRYVGIGKKRRVSTRKTCSEKCQKMARMRENV